jgi:formate hydrogenlyase subunit 3/multisubunit Na+/H+ antiporter MnhD subunit
MLVLVWAAPLIGALFAVWRGAGWLTLLAPLPALAAAALVPVGSTVSLPWLLLGVELGLDATGRLFLLFSALLWLAASLYAAGGPRVGEGGAGRFRLFFLLAMAGNLGLIVARDMVSFYLGFTLMGLAAYGLVVQPGSQRSRRAARRYLVWTIAGELVLFVALVLLAAQYGGNLAFSALASAPPGGWVVLLIVIGFGIKLALPGLHFWLPPAYAVTPAPAVAVLGGAMIKAGLLGWIRFLPPGDAALTGWGQVLIAIGVTGIFFGAVLGLMQSRARLVLGYSSISKMGVLTTGMGAALAWPAGAPVLIGALALYAAHHALVKGALFLGLGLAEQGGMRPWLLGGLGVLALALAGAPLTSGALAKSSLTAGLPAGAHHLVTVLAASAFVSTLLMARFLLLVWKGRAATPAPYPPEAVTAWLLLLALIVAAPLALAADGQLVANVVPVALGALLALLVRQASERLPAAGAARRRRRGRALRRFAGTVVSSVQQGWIETYEQLRQRLQGWSPAPGRAHPGEVPWAVAGSVWIAVGALLLYAVVFSG